MIATIKNKTLIIEIPLQAPAPSASGKTRLVATTHGSVKTSAEVEGCPLTISVNAYIPVSSAAPARLQPA